ncbi:MAG: HNH endonuclease [Planctomycetota bacterium]
MSAYLNIRIPEWLDKICVWPLMQYRKLKYGFTFRRIYLGENEYTIVEPQDYYKFSKFKWIFLICNKRPYAASELKVGKVKTKRVYLHRAIMRAPKRKLVDHRNGDGLDNRRANLRLATRSQNMMNRAKIKSKTSSKYIGVSFDKGCKRWRAAIRVNYKQRHLGSFKDEIEAAKVYDAAARKYHKDFARLNFP